MLPKYISKGEKKDRDTGMEAPLGFLTRATLEARMYRHNHHNPSSCLLPSPPAPPAPCPHLAFLHSSAQHP